MDSGRLIELIALTSFFVLAIFGIVGKLLFDAWRVRQFLRRPAISGPPAR